jgi:hypothetical protein
VPTDDDMIPRPADRPPAPPFTPQPTVPGPYHAVVRGPNGLDASVSGSPEIVGAHLRAMADVLDPCRVVIRQEPHHR